MSELKATTAEEIVQNEKECDYMDELFGGVKMPPTQVYLKYEADKVIAELGRRLNEAHTELELWRDGSIISEEHQKELDGTRHHKYKRCLAMALWCEAMRGHYLSYEEPKWFWYRKWSERWLELADKFKEAV